ncbi:MAG: glycosyltransferase [Anaerolineales bacterium]|nr:glycosyltransferase [Anaerolineales bacterium]
MRVLHINTTSHIGGAARAMRRFHAALIEKNHQSQFLVGRSKFPEDPLVHLIWDEVSSFRSLTNSLISRIGNQVEKYKGIHPWSNRTTLRIVDTPIYLWADILDLRNLFGGYFNLWSLPALSAGKPVVWRLPDLWALTGHCAYPYDCQRWKTGCHHCPLLTKEGRKIVEPSPTILDGTRRVWQAKKDLYQKSNLHIIVTTKWMQENVRQSIQGNALSINVISNGVNLEIFKPITRSEARSRLGLPHDEKLLLWAAGGKGNYRKGYHLAVKALEEIQEKGELTPTLITMGGEEGWNQPEVLQKVRHFGYIRDAEQQAVIYAAADAFICSTLADGQPQTALESLACGTPIIAFNLGPMPDLAIQGKTGFIAPETTVQSLREEIEKFLLLEELHPVMREHCRNQALEKYDLSKQTEEYVRLYQEILINHRSKVPHGNI